MSASLELRDMVPLHDRPDAVVRSWNANASAWTRAVRSRVIESRRVATDAAIIDAVTQRSPSAVLDAGCGEGWLCRALAARGVATVVGFDGSVELIEAARAGSGEYHHLLYTEFSTSPERVGLRRFDAAVCNFSVFDEDLSALLRSLKAVLKEDGMLLIQTVHPWAAQDQESYVDRWRTETFASCPLELVEPMPWYFRTMASWSAVFRDAGFTISRIIEPRHPETHALLSIIFIASPSDAQRIR